MLLLRSLYSELGWVGLGWVGQEREEQPFGGAASAREREGISGASCCALEERVGRFPVAGNDREQQRQTTPRQWASRGDFFAPAHP